MLVLTRRDGESILIGDVLLKIVTVSKGRVRLAFDAPTDIKILRSELADPHKVLEQSPPTRS